MLRATLELLESAHGPDTYVELPFEWPESPSQVRNASKDLPPAPITALLLKKPWLLPRLYSGRIPHGEADSMPDPSIDPPVGGGSLGRSRQR